MLIKKSFAILAIIPVITIGIAPASSFAADGTYVTSSVAPNNNYRSNCAGGGLACIDALTRQAQAALQDAQQMASTANTGHLQASSAWGQQSTGEMKYLNDANLSNEKAILLNAAPGGSYAAAYVDQVNSDLGTIPNGQIQLPPRSGARFYCSGPIESGIATAGAILAINSQSDCASQTNRCQLVPLGVGTGSFSCQDVGTQTNGSNQNLALQILNASNPLDASGYPLPVGYKLQLVYDSSGLGTVQQIIEKDATGAVDKIWNVTGGQWATLTLWDRNGTWLQRWNPDSATGTKILNTFINQYGMDESALRSIASNNPAVFVETTMPPGLLGLLHSNIAGNLTNLATAAGSKPDGNVFSSQNEWGIYNQSAQKVFVQQTVSFVGTKLAASLSGQVIYDLGPQGKDMTYGGGLKLIQNNKNTPAQSTTAFDVTRLKTRQGVQFEVNILEGQKFFVANPAALLQSNPFGAAVDSSTGYFTRTKAYGGDLQLIQGSNVFIVDSSGRPHPVQKPFYFNDPNNGAGSSTIQLPAALDHINESSQIGVYKMQMPFTFTEAAGMNTQACVPENGGSSSINTSASTIFTTSPGSHARSVSQKVTDQGVNLVANVGINGIIDVVTNIFGKVAGRVSAGLASADTTGGGMFSGFSAPNPAMLPSCPVQ